MNKQEFEQMLITEMFDGFPAEVTRHITANEHSSREQVLESILEDMMHTVSVFQQDPVRMKNALKRIMVDVVADIVEAQNLPEEEITEEDEEFNRGEHLYQTRKDYECEKQYES